MKKVMEEVFEDARKNFWVDPETHFIHHQTIDDWIKTFGLVKKSVLASFVTGIMAGLAAMFWLGFKAYMKITGHD